MRHPRPSISFGFKQVVICEDEALLKTIKAYANKLKCPICGGQLEGIISIEKSFGLSCVYNRNEYYITLDAVSKLPVPAVISETVRVYVSKFQYVIFQTPISTTITPKYVDSEGMVMANNSKLITPPPLVLLGSIFNFQSLNRDKLAKKLKVLLVLQ